MSMTKPDAMKIAHAIMVIRPDWNFAGIMAALAKAPEAADFGTVLIAMATAASDPGSETPAAYVNPVYWPTWSVNADADRALSRRDQLERQRAANIRAEWAYADRLAATPERISQIRASSPWPRKGDPA